MIIVEGDQVSYKKTCRRRRQIFQTVQPRQNMLRSTLAVFLLLSVLSSQSSGNHVQDPEEGEVESVEELVLEREEEGAFFGWINHESLSEIGQ